MECGFATSSTATDNSILELDSQAFPWHDDPLGIDGSEDPFLCDDEHTFAAGRLPDDSQPNTNAGTNPFELFHEAISLSQVNACYWVTLSGSLLAAMFLQYFAF